MEESKGNVMTEQEMAGFVKAYNMVRNNFGEFLKENVSEEDIPLFFKAAALYFVQGRMCSIHEELLAEIEKSDKSDGEYLDKLREDCHSVIMAGHTIWENICGYTE